MYQKNYTRHSQGISYCSETRHQFITTELFLESDVDFQAD